MSDDKPIIKATTPHSNKYDTKIDVYTSDPRGPHESIHIAVDSESKSAHILCSEMPVDPPPKFGFITKGGLNKCRFSLTVEKFSGFLKRRAGAVFIPNSLANILAVYLSLHII